MDKAAAKHTSTAESTARVAGEPQQSGLESHSLLQLQSAIGNQAVLRLLQDRTFQAKGAVSQPSDAYEQEADHIAEQVVSTPEPRLQRACACGGECPKCQTEQGSHQHQLLQTKQMGSSSSGPTAVPPIVHEVLRSPGQSLDPAARAFMEPRLGHDFSQVRVHADATAAESARSVNARAYTLGQHIVFDSGQYLSGGDQGKRLLAHELAHTIQQRQFGQRDDPLTRSTTESTHSTFPGLIQRQPNPTEQTTHAKGQARITKVVLYKPSQAVFFLDDGTSVARPITRHCDPRPGTYTLKNSVVAGLTCLGKPLDGNWIFAIEPPQPGIYAGDSELVVVSGGGEVDVESEGVGAGGEKKTKQPTVTHRSVKEIWKDIEKLPKHVQEFLIDPKYGISASAGDYEMLLRVGKKLEAAGVSPDELFEYRRKTGPRSSFANYDAIIDSFLSARASKQAQREQNVAEREKAETKLFGLEALFKKYEQYEAFSMAGKYGFGGFQDQADQLREELDKELPLYGFANIAAFEKAIRSYEATFEKETVSIAFDLLLKYEHLLISEYEHFSPGKTGSTSKAAKMLESLGRVREPAQALYETASRERSTARENEIDRDLLGPGPDEERLRREAAKHEQQAEEMVTGAVPEHSIVSWQDFPREELVSRTTTEDVRYQMAWYIATHEAAIQRARDLLKEKPSRLYELDNLLALSYVEQGIEKGSIQDLIIQRRIKQIESDKTAKEILLAIIAIALAVVTFGGGTVGLIAAGAAFGLSLAQALIAIEDYDTKTTLYLSQLLSQEPSAAWAIIAVVSAGLDAAAVVQAAKAVVPAAKAFNKSKNILELKANLAGLEERVRANVLKAADKAARAAEAEQQFASALKTLGRPGGKVGMKTGVMHVLGEEAVKLVAVIYYFVKSRALKVTFRKFLQQLEKEGLIEISKLAPAERMALQRAYEEAMELSRAGQLPYGKKIYGKISDRTRAVYSLEDVDSLAAEGKALGKTEDDIIKTLDSRARGEDITEAGAEMRIDPTEVDELRATPNAPYVSNYDQWVGNSRRLGDNLTAAGHPKPGPGYQAHHIIPSNEAPEELRILLRKNEIDINSEFNGIWLPTGQKSPNLSAEFKHEFLTGSQEYFARLRAILIKEKPLTKEQVIDKLRKIAIYLDEGKLPPWKL